MTPASPPSPPHPPEAMLDTDTIPLARTRSRTRRRRPRNLFVYALIAPAALFMLVVHVIPTAAGVYMSLLQLDLYHFSQLFHAPFVLFDNYRDIVLDPENPIRSDLWNA